MFDSPCDRVTKFLAEWNKMQDRGDMIYGLHLGDDEREAKLLVSDLQSLASKSLVEVGPAICTYHGGVDYCDRTETRVPVFADLSSLEPEQRVILVLKHHRHGPEDPPCGYCHACGELLPDLIMQWCPACGATDYDE